MQNVTITEITGKGDVDFDQAIDTDTVIASGGGVAVNGAVSQSAFNTGLNTGIIAGDDVEPLLMLLDGVPVVLARDLLP